MGIHRKFTQEFKLSVIAELETKKLVEVCREHDLSPSTVAGWKHDYEANPQEAFKGHGNIWKEDARIAHYERLVGKLYAENAFLKKVYERLKQEQAEDKRKRRSLLK